MTDTAPEAITQADVREAEDALDAYQADGFAMSFAMSPDERIGFKAGYRYAAHRRLTSHSAGEGLREGWRLVPVEADDAMATAAAAELQRQTTYLGWEPTAIWSAMLGAAPPPPPAPPSDAGSTTPSGGAGVEALEAGRTFLRKANSAWACGEPSHRVRDMLKAAEDFQFALDRLDATTPSPGADPELIYEALRFYVWAAGEGICTVDGENALEPEEGLFRYSNRTRDEEWETLAERYRLATIPSPDASPDSGERASVIGRLTNCIAAQRAIIDGPQYGTVETEAARLSYAAMLDARGLLAASLDSLSGGAEERLREALTPHGETKSAYMGEFSWTEWLPDQDGVEQGHERVVPWTTIKEIMAAIRERAGVDKLDEADALALHPSPEAPANRQEAGEADVVSREMTAFEAAYPLSNAAKYRGGEVVAGRVRYEEPDVDKMFGAWLVRATLTSPKDVKRGEA